jgi:hypothetical protein
MDEVSVTRIDYESASGQRAPGARPVQDNVAIAGATCSPIVERHQQRTAEMAELNSRFTFGADVDKDQRLAHFLS